MKIYRRIFELSVYQYFWKKTLLTRTFKVLVPVCRIDVLRATVCHYPPFLLIKHSLKVVSSCLMFIYLEMWSTIGHQLIITCWNIVSWVNLCIYVYFLWDILVSQMFLNSCVEMDYQYHVRKSILLLSWLRYGLHVYS